MEDEGRCISPYLRHFPHTKAATYTDSNSSQPGRVLSFTLTYAERTMGTIICGLDMLKNDLADLRSKSSTLEGILTAVLAKGDLTIHVTGGFTDPNNGWENFDNYLAHQRKTGHTKQIESHWKQ